MNATRQITPQSAEVIHGWEGWPSQSPIIARFKRWPYVVVAFVVFFFLLIITGCIFAMIVNGLSITPASNVLDSIFVPALISLLMLTTISGLTFWLYRDYKNSAQVFDRFGVIRNDGRRFWWANFIRLDEFVNHRGSSEWTYRYELVFNNGKAVVMLPKLKNSDEVLQLVTNLPGERSVIRSSAG
jgi:hypothetical protein